jgi:hypothetical protein
MHKVSTHHNMDSQMENTWKGFNQWYYHNITEIANKTVDMLTCVYECYHAYALSVSTI